MLLQPWKCCIAHPSYDSSVVLLTFIYRDWLVIGARSEDAAVVVDSGCDEFLSVRCVCEIGCTRGIWSFN